MNEKNIYLKSLNMNNFRHKQENPKIIGFVMYTPQNLTPRPCFKVEYESDGTIDHIAYEVFVEGDWEFI